MSELIRREDAIKTTWQEPSYTDPYNVLTEVRDRINALPAFSPWHRVEDGLPEMIEIVPCYVCSETLVLYDAESGYMDIGYAREKPDNNGADWLWGKPFKNPTHWMPLPEPPKEDA